MRNNNNLPYIKFLKIIFSIVVILSAWEIFALIVNDDYFLPDVFVTLRSLLNVLTSGSFFKVILTSVYRVILGLLLATVSGILIAVLCHKFELLNTVLSPIVSIMKATPVACIIVLLWIRLNYTQIAVFVVVLMVLPVIWQNVYNGLKAIDKNLAEVADVFELTRAKRLTALVIPSILAYLLPALVTSVGLAWKAEVAAEIMTNSNMGKLIYDFKTVSYDTASIFAWTVVIVVLSIVFEVITKRLLRRAINELTA